MIRIFVIIFSMILFLGVGVFLLFPTIKEFERSKKIDDEILELQKEAEKINDKNDYLRKRLEYLKSDDYKRKIAKDRLNLREPGEKVVYIQPIVENATKEKTQKNDYFDNQKRKNTNNPIKWYNFLFGK